MISCAQFVAQVRKCSKQNSIELEHVFVFGYVKAFQPEMKVRELESYKGVYCSLCKVLGKEYGPIARFTLNYDFTFLALLRLSLLEKCYGFKPKRCSFNPFKKCCIYLEDEGVLKSVAAIAMIFFYYKVKDNLSDSRFMGKIASIMIMPWAWLAHRKAKKIEPGVEAMCSKAMSEQAKLEASDCTSMDKAAEPTSRLLSYIAGQSARDSHEKIALERFGYCLGRWIYLIDAADDIDSDIKNNNFNPFVSCMALNPNNYIEYAKHSMNICISEMVSCLEKIEIKRFNPIISNIVIYGLAKQQSLILEKREANEKSL